MTKMIKINSISGGRTSSYLAKHYPADYDLFALVKIDDINCAPKDKGIVKIISDKIGDDFIATAESDLTLKVVIDLEQIIGREILWVHGLSFEKMIKKKGNVLPNIQWRFCTTEMKMRPIWDWWYKNINEKVKMGIGFRYDEIERAEKLSTTFKGVVGRSKNGNQNKWEEVEWREGYFPLIEDKVNHWHVVRWANTTSLIFPDDSNCVGCFHKPLQQLRKNWEVENIKMQWFSNQEKKSTWKKEVNYANIKKLGLQQDFNFGTGSGCDAGYCTD